MQHSRHMGPPEFGCAFPLDHVKFYLLRRGKYHCAKRLALHAKRSIGTDIECVVNMVVSFIGLPHRWSDIQ